MKTTKEEKVVEVPADVRMKFLHNGKSFTFEIDYELFSFIKRKRLKTKFLFNIKVDIKKDIIFYKALQHDNILLKINSPSDAFIWSETLEGWKFWSELNSEYNELINKKNK